MVVFYLTTVTVDRRHFPPRPAVHDIAGQLDGRNEIATGSVAGAVDILGGVVVLWKNLAQQSRFYPLPQAGRQRANANANVNVKGNVKINVG